MTTTHDVSYYEAQLLPVLPSITNAIVRQAVIDLIAFTKKKELETAPPAPQTIKPGTSEFDSIISSIDLSHIEASAGLATRTLVENLIQYTELLMQQA